MLSVTDALNIVLREVKVGLAESITLTKGLGRILAEELSTPEDSPPFDKALMDGFAVRVAAKHSPPFPSGATTVSFQIAETITAGNPPVIALQDGLASRIMTGAPLPEGCNCVVPIELTQFDESRPESVTIPRTAMSVEAHLMRRGTAALAGSVLLRAGTRLQPQQIAALAEFGMATIVVQSQPRVAVLATGDELTAVDQPLAPGRIRNSNEPMLLAQISAAGGLPVALGSVKDNIPEIQTGVQRGLQHDILLLTGGVSAGILDLVPQQLLAAGVKQIFHGVHMKPGKPLWFGCHHHDNRRCLVFGLPGNPVSTLACFELFVRPALQKFCGMPPGTVPAKATLEGSIQVKGNRPVYHPVKVTIRTGQLTAVLVPWSGSSDLRATVDANGMALLLPEHGPYQPGEMVEVWLWGDQRLL